MPLGTPAFSLIETAIVLIIMGLVGGMALPTLKWMLEWQKETVTVHHQEKILYALASYAVQNKMLPYAANPGLPSGSQDKGRCRGIVPYADLGLPESIAKDGHHRWFTYVVDGYYAIPSPSGINRLCNQKGHSTPLRVKGMQDKIAIALISHGPQGRGAYPNPMAIPPQGEDEMQNATSDMEIIDRPWSRDPSNPFSHKVAWVTAQNLLAVYAHAPCPPVDMRVGSQGNATLLAPKDPQKVDKKAEGFSRIGRETIDSSHSPGNRFTFGAKK